MAFRSAEDDAQRSEVLRACLLSIADDLGLRTRSGELIGVKFESLRYCVGYFSEHDIENVYIDEKYTKKDMDSLRDAVGVYLHECAHLIVSSVLGYQLKHCWLFFAVNLAINIKFDALLRQQNPTYEIDPTFHEYSWSTHALRIYNIHEDQEIIDPNKLDYALLSRRIAEATCVAFACAQGSDLPLHNIIGQIVDFYSEKIKLENQKVNKRWIVEAVIDQLIPIYKITASFMLVRLASLNN